MAFSITIEGIVSFINSIIQNPKLLTNYEYFLPFLKNSELLTIFCQISIINEISIHIRKMSLILCNNIILDLWIKMAWDANEKEAYFFKAYSMLCINSNGKDSLIKFTVDLNLV